VGELVYGRVTKLVPFGAFVQVGDGIEGLVHISEMAVHHVDQPDQVVTPGEELWVKIIDIDLARRRISLSIKQAAEGGEVAAEYREAFGEHAYDEHGNYIGADTYTAFEPESEAQAAWAGYLAEQAHQDAAGTSDAPEGAGDGTEPLATAPSGPEAVATANAAAEPEAALAVTHAAPAPLAAEALADDDIAELGKLDEVAGLDDMPELDSLDETPATRVTPAATEAIDQDGEES
jgi:small subunit ribosomal protein S1